VANRFHQNDGAIYHSDWFGDKKFIPENFFLKYRINNLSQKNCELLDKMRNFYGINISYITNDDLIEDVDVGSAKAFIKNGTIYINVDNATIDSPIHEMLHLFIGSISLSNPQLF
jgi:hypothetical protein